MLKIETTFIEAFIKMNSFFVKNNIPFCLIGGIAAGFWGEPRYTSDMDFTVIGDADNFENIKKKLQKEGYHFADKGNGQLQIRSLKKMSFQADLILAEMDYQKWVIKRATKVSVFNTQTNIVSAEDLIILKLVANRRQDLLDIENVLRKQHGKLDKDYLKKWFAYWQVEERFEKEFGSEFPL